MNFDKFNAIVESRLHYGEIDAASVVSEFKNVGCGDNYRIFLKVEDNIIQEATYTTTGCSFSLASLSIICDLVKGKTLEEAKQLAAQELEAAPQDVRYEAGRFNVVGTDHAIGLFELAGRQAGGHIFVDHTHTVSGPTWPNGCHISEVEVDPQTGSVAVVRYTSMNDVGRVVNPMIVRGQLDGGAVQGIGQALTEQIVYDEGGGQLVTGSLMDYAAPRAHDIAATFVTEMDESTPCKNNPLGVKGVGELGTIGATPSIVNAVADALARNGRAGLAPRLQMPLSPGRLWALLQSA